MNLVIDFGNTRTKMALFENRTLLEQFVFKPRVSLKEIQKIFKSYPQIKNSIVSSVINHAKDKINFLSNHTHYMQFDTATKVPVINKYKTPESLGRDRLAAAIGANSLYKNANLLIIDVGTCIKTDLITEQNEYIGGSISPGIAMRYNALNEFTDRLPKLSMNQNYNSLTGCSTNESIYNGVQNGALYELKGFIAAYTKQYPDIKIILTGGDASFFELELKNHIFACPELVLIGLNEILLFNASN